MGDHSPHEDDVVETNGKLDPTRSSFVKVDYFVIHLKIRIKIKLLIFKNSLLTAVEWFWKSSQPKWQKLCVIFFKDLATVFEICFCFQKDLKQIKFDFS